MDRAAWWPSSPCGGHKELGMNERLSTTAHVASAGRSDRERKQGLLRTRMAFTSGLIASE